MILTTTALFIILLSPDSLMTVSINSVLTLPLTSSCMLPKSPTCLSYKSIIGLNYTHSNDLTLCNYIHLYGLMWCFSIVK